MRIGYYWRASDSSPSESVGLWWPRLGRQGAIRMNQDRLRTVNASTEPSTLALADWGTRPATSLVREAERQGGRQAERQISGDSLSHSGVGCHYAQLKEIKGVASMIRHNLVYSMSIFRNVICLMNGDGRVVRALEQRNEG